ncbi:MAG: radical SAM protein, partial [Planctomycetota bacterium]
MSTPCQQQTGRPGDPCGLALADRPDRDRADRTLERALANADVLSAAQRDNVRRLADDLYFARSVWESVPPRLNVEFHTRCNLKCPFCDVPRGGRAALSVELLEQVLDEIGPGVMEIMPLLGSEPTLGPLAECAPLLRRHNIRYNFITNGIRLDAAYLAPIEDVTSRIQFSIQSPRPDVYRQLMPHSGFERVVANLDHAASFGRRTGVQVAVSAIVMAENVLHLDELVRFAAEHGVERVVLAKLFPATERYADHAPQLHHEAGAIHDALERVVCAAVEHGIFLETCVDQLAHRDEIPPPRPSPFDILQETSRLIDLYHPGFCISTATTAFLHPDGAVTPSGRWSRTQG